MKIRKAVIPVAGLGTRFLPITKSVPKELLPIIDRPVIDYIVSEASSAGITEILFIVSKNKDAITDYFDRNLFLEDHLAKKGKLQELSQITYPTTYANFTYLRQGVANGLGDAILLAKNFANNEPIAVLLGDDVIDAPKPALAQLIKAYEQVEKTIVGVQEVALDAVHKYGIINPSDHKNDALLQISELVEKPSAENAPSQLAALGRYILTPNIFDYLETQTAGKGGEIQLTDALNRLAHDEKIYACKFSGKRYDLGDKLGFLQANIEFALKNPDLKQQFANYLTNLNISDT